MLSPKHRSVQIIIFDTLWVQVNHKSESSHGKKKSLDFQKSCWGIKLGTFGSEIYHPNNFSMRQEDFITKNLGLYLKIRYYNILGPSTAVWNLSFRLMPKDISGGGLVDFEFEILQFALMQVFAS